MKKTIALIIAMILPFVLTSCAKKESDRITKQSFAFDTVINITADKKDKTVVSRALKECSKYELIFSRTNEKSELYKINNSQQSDISDDLQRVLQFSKDFSEKTNGAFDVTVEPLVKLWDVNNRTSPPSKKQVDDSLKNVGYKKLTLSPIDTNGATLDLGAVAKGYIADRLCDFFKESGTENVIIDLGGNVIVIGDYTVGIRNPFSPDEVYATIRLKDKSAVTSGAYQRYFEYEGKRYHHIIDPRTGYPAESSVASVTVISPSSMQADALSTAIFILGSDGLSLCEEFPDTDAIIITDEGKVITTDNFEEKYNLHIE